MSNESAKGYLILALKNLKCSKELADKILDELDYLFDIKTTSEAEEYYLNSKFQ